MVTKKMAEPITIKAPNLQTIEIRIVGEAPLVQNKFSAKSANQMLQTQMEGTTARSKKKRDARDPDAEYHAAMHVDEQGRHGIPAPAFRSAMISACRLVGFTMTKAKLSIFVEADSFDKDDGTPLVFLEGEPRMHTGNVRLESGVASISIRPMWREWAATVRVKFDADQFTISDVINLMSRAGQQVGIGEGRPDSKKSHGMGWGLFKLENQNGKRTDEGAV